MKIAWAVILFGLAISFAAAADVRQLSDAYQQGRSISASEAAMLEKKLLATPEDVPDRVRLIAFYTLAPQAPAPQEALKGRRSQLLWMAEHEPESWLWSQRPYGCAVYLKGDRLSDPEGFGLIREQWLEHLARDSGNEKIRANAASFLQLGDAETAIRLIRGMGNSRYLGTEYALLLLGVTARDYEAGLPLFSDAAVRQGELAARALAELNSSSDAQLIGGAGFWLAPDGAILWSQRKLDWDYSPLAKSLLKRARELEPNRIEWLVANPELPSPGEQRPLMSVRVGGAVMGSKKLSSVQPEAPPSLRGLRGAVLVDIAIDGDGKVVAAVAKSGPPELYAISLDAVKQWRYQPSTVHSAPVIVITTVEFNYR